ncbi:hypothetical protein A7982_13417 [Minicystis rosea]|nr:hypothetical protein A7982_13417 [Minicystis rosea]
MTVSQDLYPRIQQLIEELKNNPKIVVVESILEGPNLAEVTEVNPLFIRLGHDLHKTYYSVLNRLKIRWEAKSPETFGDIDLPNIITTPSMDQGFRVYAESDETPMPSPFETFAMRGAETAYGATGGGTVMSHTIRSGWRSYPFDMNGFLELALAFKGYHRWTEVVWWAFVQGRPDRFDVTDFEAEIPPLFDDVSLESVRAVFDRVKKKG